MHSIRRHLVRSTLLGAASLGVACAIPQAALAQALTAPLDPATVPQFVNPLINPLDPGFVWQPDPGTTDTYTIEVQEFFQDLGLFRLPLPITRVWGYGKQGQAGTFPGRTFEVQQGEPITVTYLNKLVRPVSGLPLPNRMPVDNTLDWANPGSLGGITPVPVVAHLHGGDSEYLSDGLPDAWGTPCANTQPPFVCKFAQTPQSGRLFSAPYQYDNAQEAGTLWYHDHAVGITRTNVYMGLAGFYLLRDPNENALRSDGVLPSHPYEIPVVIQDREFTRARQLFYPAGDVGLPVNSHLPEFFGRVVLVNGQAWPKLNVEPRKYRLRLLNGSDSRFYDLRFEYFAAGAPVEPGAGTRVPVLVVGNELGLLNTPATPSLDTPVDAGDGPVRPGEPNLMPIGPGERYDLVVDFSQVPANSRVLVTNSANSPYPNADPVEPGLTDQIMAFDVRLPLNAAVPNATVAMGTDLRPLHGALPVPDAAGIPVRRILLFEGTDVFGRLQTMLGPVDPDPVTGQQGTLTFKDPTTERPALGTTEIWEFYNATVDAHPIHMHLVDFRILDRQTFSADLAPKVNSDGSDGAIMDPASIVKTGAPVVPNAWEAGKKDTVKSFPGEVTRVLVSFNREGEYVYHCHILSHEDHEMMRPYEVVAAPAQ